MNEENILFYKVDLFMKHHILPTFDPNDIFWWFSLSGGKDSYCMCLAIYLWYVQHGFRLNGMAFTIKQWNNRVFESLKKQIDWVPVICIDAFEETQNLIDYETGEQAPCKLCSSIRKSVGDASLLPLMDKRKINIIARGLHLGDTSISYLWRWVYSDNLQQSFIRSKYHPLVNISNNVFLAKPLCYAREIETQQFSYAHKYAPSCCMCPACKFPSRRDIVEESLLYIYKNENKNLWEFTVPGIIDYLKVIAPYDYKELINNSIDGFAIKHNHILDSYFPYTLDYFRNKMKPIDVNLFNNSIYLDDIGKNSVLLGKKFSYTGKPPIPKFFVSGITLSEYEKRMIATLGPFWGFMGIKQSQQKHIINMQTKILDIVPDDLWSQVNTAINIFYRGGNNNDNDEKTRFDYENISCNCNN